MYNMNSKVAGCPRNSLKDFHGLKYLAVSQVIIPQILVFCLAQA